LYQDIQQAAVVVNISNLTLLGRRLFLLTTAKKKVRVTVVYGRWDIICADGIMDDYRQEEQGPFPNVLPLSLLIRQSFLLLESIRM
jgi:hypothetical protein